MCGYDTFIFALYDVLMCSVSAVYTCVVKFCSNCALLPSYMQFSPYTHACIVYCDL